MIPVSVLIVTLNEAENLPRCLAALQDFDDILIVDSGGCDQTLQVAQSFGARIENFNWNGEYPKKRQWCLDNLNIKNDFVFFVDADEVITPELVEEIAQLNFSAAGYFVLGQYIWHDKALRFGLRNNKLALFNRHKIEFPVIDDLESDGMGEIEGHYQPVLKANCSHESIQQLKSSLHHYADDHGAAWEKRHKRYAQWEAEMIIKEAYPVDPVFWRQQLKILFRRTPLRGGIAFCHSFFLRLGFLDGVSGYRFARSRWRYYQMVSGALKTNRALVQSGEGRKERSVL